MKPIPDCVPDALELVLATARLVSDDAFIHRKVLRKVMRTLMEETDFGPGPGDLTFRCLTSAYKALGVKDPYEKEKARRNKAMLGLEKSFRGYLDVAPDRLAACLNLVLAGSTDSMDALGRTEMERAILEQLDVPLGRDDRDVFLRTIARAESVMYVTANAGEILLDKLLLEELSNRRKTVAVVATKPILDAATAVDAETVGLSDTAEVIDPGAPMFGLMQERASSSFREAFAAAEVVIAKGEANYETLQAAEREIFFLLQVRCEHLAERLGVPVDSNALIHHRGRPGTGVLETVGTRESKTENGK